MHRTSKTVLGAALLLGFSATAARADLSIEALGAPRDGGSWYQDFALSSSSGAFENVGMVMLRLPGDDGTSGFNSPAWDFTIDDGNSSQYSQMVLGDFLTASSFDSTSTLRWTSHFGDDEPDGIEGDRSGQSFALALFAYNDLWWTAPIQAAVAEFDGASDSWTFHQGPGLTWEEYVDMGGPVQQVPAPSSAMLALVGLVLLRKPSRGAP